MNAPAQHDSARLAEGAHSLARQVIAGFFRITHHGLALLGLAVAVGLAALAWQPELRQQSQTWLLAWAASDQPDTIDLAPEPGPTQRATAANPSDLPPEQSSMALWLARQYRVAPEPVAARVAEA
jgi:hypothetical protein